MTDADRVEPHWLDAKDAIAIHDRQLAEHGGPGGVRDETLLESALARPINKWNYGDDDWASLAASYAYGLARNHPFIDGNKRTSWVLARLFLMLNGLTLNFDKADATWVMQQLAAGKLSEEEMTDWFRQHIEKSA